MHLLTRCWYPRCRCYLLPDTALVHPGEPSACRKRNIMSDRKHEKKSGFTSLNYWTGSKFCVAVYDSISCYRALRVWQQGEILTSYGLSLRDHNSGLHDFMFQAENKCTASLAWTKSLWSFKNPAYVVERKKKDWWLARYTQLQFEIAPAAGTEASLTTKGRCHGGGGIFLGTPVRHRNSTEIKSFPVLVLHSFDTQSSVTKSW